MYHGKTPLRDTLSLALEGPCIQVQYARHFLINLVTQLRLAILMWQLPLRLLVSLVTGTQCYTNCVLGP